MTPDKDIMEFVFVERHPTPYPWCDILLVDGNRRKEAAIQRWVMDVTRAYPGAKTEFVSLSELNRRREASERQVYGLSQVISEADLKSRDFSVSQVRSSAISSWHKSSMLLIFISKSVPTDDSPLCSCVFTVSWKSWMR